MGKNSKKNRRKRLKNKGRNEDQVKNGDKQNTNVESTNVTATTTLGSSLKDAPCRDIIRNDGKRTKDLVAHTDNKVDNDGHKDDLNPLHSQQQEFLSTLTHDERYHFFSNTRIDPTRRAALWMEQADLGEGLVNRYAWATPTTSSCLRIFQEFSPLVEMGCGSNAYWANWMVRTSKETTSLGSNKVIDIVTFDGDIQEGGRIGDTKNHGLALQRKREGTNREIYGTDGRNNSCLVRHGGPEVLSDPEIVKSNRTLFLCYPDEYDDDTTHDGDKDLNESIEDKDDDDDDDDDDEGEAGEPMIDDDDPQQGQSHRVVPSSFGWQCLDHYHGMYVIHVGELMLDANLSMDQAPWGRSSSPEFQQRLASEFHCILKIQLPSNWLHVRDSISVWKRSELCPIVFAAGGDDDDGGEGDDEEEVVEYRYIPPEEMLPTDLAAPCVAHLLPLASSPSPKKASSKGLSSGLAKKDGNNQDPKSAKRKLESTLKKSPADKVATDKNPTKAVIDSTPVTDLRSTNGQSTSHKKRNMLPTSEKKARPNGSENGDDTATSHTYLTPW